MKHLATGGMAEVLLARLVGPHGFHHVVIKRIRPDQAQDDRFVRMFLDEARLAAMLQHPNIVKVHEIGEQAGEFFFAMEYVHGEDLRRVLMEVHKRRDKLPIALITGIVAAAAGGLHHAHTLSGPDRQPLGIVHRDVSPANILVGYDGTVRVADFGIAKAALRTVETRSGTLKGKVSYMSPEQVTGKPIDRRSDVFALGIVLYEVATARRLFKGDNDFLTMSAIVQGDIPLPSTHRPDLPRVLEDIIMKALAPAAGDRYQSAEELRAALEKFTTSLGMKMSAGSIADYMKKLFGTRPEPWLTDADEPTITTTIDFDGSASGVVQPPDAAVRNASLPDTIRPAASAPIVYARTDVTGRPPTASDLDSSGAFEVKPTGSQDRLAWPREPTPVQPRSRRWLGVVIGGVAAAAIALAVGFTSGGSSSDPAAATGGVRRMAQPVDDTAKDPPPEPPAGEAPPEPVADLEPTIAEPTIAPPVKQPPKVIKAEPGRKRTRTRERESKVVKAGPKPDRKTARRPRPRPDRKPKPPAEKKPAGWDPNALFPK